MDFKVHLFIIFTLLFFTSDFGIPFETIEDVMKEYPDYKLMMMEGWDVFFVYRALAVSTIVVLFFQAFLYFCFVLGRSFVCCILGKGPN